MKYLLRSAFSSLWHERWINLISIVSIATALFILGFSLVALYNIQKFVKDTPENFTIMVFLKSDAKDAEIQQLMEVLKTSGLVRKINYISKEEALNDMKKALGQDAYILDGLEENPLFATLELVIKEEALQKEKIKAFVNEIQESPIVEKVLYGEGILGVLLSIYKGARLITVVIAVLFSIAVAFIASSTVKILFFRRQEEIEILKLLGATRTFISTPFIIEGTVIGFLGGTLSAVSVYTIFNFLKGMGNAEIPLLMQLQLPLIIVAAMIIGGLFLGLLGSIFALGRIKY